MKINHLLAACVAITLGLAASPLHAQANPTPASDDPMAGLNLGPKKSDSGATSHFVEQFKGHLITMDHGSPKEVDTATLSGVKYWAFYHSASWCGPCQAFTPQLVEFYNYFKKSHPNFEIVFVSADHDDAAMLAYMKDDRMPWPGIKYADIDKQGVSVGKYFGPGIPCLVLTDADGKVLADTFDGDKFLGPGQVMEKIKKLVPRPE